MSEKDDRNQEVTFDQFIDFLKRTGAIMACPACGKKGWTVLSDAPGVMLEVDIPSHSNRGFPVYSSYCNNCGAIRNHASTVVREWLSKDRSEDGQDGDGKEEINEQ